MKKERLIGRTFRIALVLVMTVGLLGSLPSIVAADDVVTFPDPNLEGRVRQAIGKPTGPIYASDLEGLTSLAAGSCGIYNLTGLEYCTNLTWLSLEVNRIGDISPLANLTKLTWLDISSLQVLSDISPLANLSNLTWLDLGTNWLSDISPLANLTSLTSLNLQFNRVLSDISPLANLTSLTSASLRYNQIGDISPLANLTNLISVDLHSNRVIDVSPLANLTNLTGLNLRENLITDISPLANLINLTGLYLQDNPISDISPLANLTDLGGLGLGSDQITDITLLANFTDLGYLVLTGCRVSDITPLANLTKLYELHLGWNHVLADISPLTNLTNLRHLWLVSNDISDITHLANLTNLLFLDLRENQVSDIWPLVQNLGLNRGDVLDLRWNPLNSNSVNVYIPELATRQFSQLLWNTSNQLPSQPSNLSPPNGATDMSLTPTLQSSAFLDPDAGDIHAASQWQIRASAGNYSSPVFDSGTDTSNLISIAIATGILNASTIYYWHVRHRDDRGDWSDYSSETSFATILEPTQCIDTATGTGTVCFTPSHGIIEDLQAVPAPSPYPPGVNFTHGMFTFRVTGLTPGQSVTLTVEFPDPIPTRWVWWKYHNETWSRIPISRTADPRIIEFTLTDGAYPGDEDDIPGQITDQGGPGSLGSVGWETYPIDKARVLLPWIAVFATIIAGVSLLVLRHRHSQLQDD